MLMTDEESASAAGCSAGGSVVVGFDRKLFSLLPRDDDEDEAGLALSIAGWDKVDADAIDFVVGTVDVVDVVVDVAGDVADDVVFVA